MDLKRYEQLMVDDLVIKCKDELDYQCITTDGSISIGVYFNSAGLETCDGECLNGRRILITMYPGVKSDLSSCDKVKESVLFLVNADSPSRAYTYKLTVRIHLEIACLQIHDMPNEGRELISELEIKGISKTIILSHKIFQ